MTRKGQQKACRRLRTILRASRARGSPLASRLSAHQEDDMSDVHGVSPIRVHCCKTLASDVTSQSMGICLGSSSSLRVGFICAVSP
eukprot:516035-Rhodomonas_salina.3